MGGINVRQVGLWSPLQVGTFVYPYARQIEAPEHSLAGSYLPAAFSIGNENLPAAHMHDIHMSSLKGMSPERFHGTFGRAFGGDEHPLTTTLEDNIDHYRATDTEFKNSFGVFTGHSELVGFLMHSIRRTDGVLRANNSGTALLEGYRGFGFAKALATQSINYLRSVGVEEVTLEVSASDERAIKLYTKCGFKIQRLFATLTARNFRRICDAIPPGVTLRRGTFDPEIINKLPKPEYVPTWRHETQSMTNIKDRIEIVTAWIGDEIVAYAMKRTPNELLTQIAARDDMWKTTVPSAVLETLFQDGNSPSATFIDMSAVKTLKLLSRHGFKITSKLFGMKKVMEKVVDFVKQGLRVL